MAPITVLSEDGTTTVDATIDGARVLVPTDAMRAAIGWELKPEGLCRGDVCVPVFGELAPDADGRVDLVAVSARLRRPTLLDADAAALVIGVSADQRSTALTGMQLPQFTLPDLDGVAHASDSWTGKKKLLVAFASW